MMDVSYQWLKYNFGETTFDGPYPLDEFWDTFDDDCSLLCGSGGTRHCRYLKDLGLMPNYSTVLGRGAKTDSLRELKDHLSFLQYIRKLVCALGGFFPKTSGARIGENSIPWLPDQS